MDVLETDSFSNSIWEYVTGTPSVYQLSKLEMKVQIKEKENQNITFVDWGKINHRYGNHLLTLGCILLF